MEMQVPGQPKNHNVSFQLDDETKNRLDGLTNRFRGRSEIIRNAVIKEIEYQEQLLEAKKTKEQKAS